MGVEVRSGDWENRLALKTRMVKALRGPVAENVGLFLVSQIAFTHEMQGRSEDDQTRVWPPRKVPSAGLVVLGNRSAVRKAIREARQNPSKTHFEIKRHVKAPDGASTTFTRAQVLGASGALAAEKNRKGKQKQAGLKGRKLQEQRRKLKQVHLEQLYNGDEEGALRTRRELAALKSSIGTAASYKRSASYLPRPVLLRTGTMRDSWTFRVEVIGAKVVLWISTSVEYAKYHELGLGVPQRRQFVVTHNDRRHIQELVADIVREEF